MPDCVPGPGRHDAGQIHVLGDPRLVDLLEAARAHGGDKGGPVVERRGLLCGPGVGAADGGARVERGEKEAPGLDHARDLAAEPSQVVDVVQHVRIRVVEAVRRERHVVEVAEDDVHVAPAGFEVDANRDSAEALERADLAA